MLETSKRVREEIDGLESEFFQLHAQLRRAGPAEQAGLLATIENRQSALLSKRQELHAGLRRESMIEASIPGLRYFGYEISQGLSGYTLVAGKDTLVRIFLGAPEDLFGPGVPEADITGSGGPLRPDADRPIPTFLRAPATLEFAALRVQGPAGLDFRVEGRMSSGFFTNAAQSFSESDNVNFYIPGGQLRHAGPYLFTTTLYRNGQAISSMFLGGEYFLRTNDLRLLIVVENHPMTPAAWSGLGRALLLVNRNFPVRTGVGPLDGEPSAGLRYTIDPVPMQLGFSGQILDPAVLEQRLDQFNTAQAAAQRPDRADRIVTVRTLLSEADVGVGNAQGRIASVVYRPESVPFASLLCQELGHTFGASVVDPPDPHSPNRRIDDPSAFDLLNRRSIPNPKPFMFARIIAADEEGLFEPQDWNAVRNALLARDPRAAAQPFR